MVAESWMSPTPKRERNSRLVSVSSWLKSMIPANGFYKPSVAIKSIPNQFRLFSQDDQQHPTQLGWVWVRSGRTSQGVNKGQMEHVHQIYQEEQSHSYASCPLDVAGQKHVPQNDLVHNYQSHTARRAQPKWRIYHRLNLSFES
jgi:hypothetical protein